jgi:protoheme IX farnesyltransferase
MMFRYSLALLLASLWPLFEGIGGKLYLAVALLLGVAFVGMSVLEARRSERGKWARRIFAYSIVYLVVIFGTLVAQGRVA